MTRDEWLYMAEDLLDENFPKWECAERGHALVLIAGLTVKLEDRGVIGKRSTTEQIVVDIEANLAHIAIGQNPFD